MVKIPNLILSQRLLLRPLQMGDGYAAFDAVRESWDDLSRWGIWTLKPYDDMTPDDVEKFVMYKQNQFESLTDLTFFALHQETQKMIGVGGLHKCDWDNGIFMLGFWVRSSETGKGYATEIGQILIQMAFQELGGQKITTCHADGNSGSQRVIQKLGFVYDGLCDNPHQLPDSHVLDELNYVMLREG